MNAAVVDETNILNAVVVVVVVVVVDVVVVDETNILSAVVVVVVDETNILSVGPKLIRRHSRERCSEASRAPANRLSASRPSSWTLIFASLKRRLTQKTTSLSASLLSEVGFDVEAPEK